MEIASLPERIVPAAWTMVLLLMILSVARHPSSIQDSGVALLLADVSLALTYLVLTVLVWRRGSASTRAAAGSGTRVGALLGMILVTSHLVESFAPLEDRSIQLVRGAGSVLLTLGLLSMAGSAAWGRTRLLKKAPIAGLFCVSTAAAMLLSCAFLLDLILEAHMASRIQGAFAASGFTDAGAFLVRNDLASALQILLELSLAALVLSLVGALLKVWLATHGRRFAVVAAFVLPVVLLVGVLGIAYADSLPRSARPPFVMLGVLSTAAALCSAHPVWSSLRARTAASR